MSAAILLPIGRINWVIDSHGAVIVGRTGHVNLSGGDLVAGAGKMDVVSAVPGLACIGWLGLNFSGHYAPRWSPSYGAYVLGVLRAHPCLVMEGRLVVEAARYSGRIRKVFRVDFPS